MIGMLTLLLPFFGGSVALLEHQGSVLVACSRFPLRQYTYVNVLMTWDEAREYCRQNYTDLATFESMEEIQQLQPTFSYSWAWIGLYDDTGSWKGVMGNQPNSWRWSATGEFSSSGFQLWRDGEPNFGNREETCVVMDDNGEWRDKPCSSLNGFICFTEGDSGQVYEYISELRTWSEAQTYCRLHHTDLAIIESSAQNSDVFNAKAASGEVWIGLYREPWRWSDNSLSSFKNWRDISPNGPYYQHCVSENGNHDWDDGDCDVDYVAICHTELRLQSSVRVILKTSADLTHSVTNAQILHMVEAALKSRGWTDFSLAWRIQPVKQTAERSPSPLCHN